MSERSGRSPLVRARRHDLDCVDLLPQEPLPDAQELVGQIANSEHGRTSLDSLLSRAPDTEYTEIWIGPRGLKLGRRTSDLDRVTPDGLRADLDDSPVLANLAAVLLRNHYERKREM